MVYLDKKHEREHMESRRQSKQSQVDKSTAEVNKLASEANAADKTTAEGRKTASEKLAQAQKIRKQIDQAKKDLAEIDKKLKKAKTEETAAETQARTATQGSRVKSDVADRNKKAAVTAQMIANAKATQQINSSPNGFAGSHLPKSEMEKVQKELDGYRSEFRKAREALRQAEEKLATEAKGKAVKSKAQEAVHQARSAATPEARQAAVDKVKPEEFVGAAQKEASEQGEKLQQALKGSFDSKEIVQALGELINILEAADSAAKKIPQSQIDNKSQTALVNAINSLRSSRQAVSRGSSLDPGSTNGLLNSINTNLKNIYRKTGKNPGQMPKNIS